MNDPMRPEDMRVSDSDRGEVQNRLRRAHEVGQLDLYEFDERVRSVWAARTRRELASVTADLPAPPPGPGRRPVFSATPGGVTMRVLTRRDEPGDLGHRRADHRRADLPVVGVGGRAAGRGAGSALRRGDRPTAASNPRTGDHGPR